MLWEQIKKRNSLGRRNGRFNLILRRHHRRRRHPITVLIYKRLCCCCIKYNEPGDYRRRVFRFVYIIFHLYIFFSFLSRLFCHTKKMFRKARYRRVRSVLLMIFALYSFCLFFVCSTSSCLHEDIKYTLQDSSNYTYISYFIFVVYCGKELYI